MLQHLSLNMLIPRSLGGYKGGKMRDRIRARSVASGLARANCGKNVSGLKKLRGRVSYRLRFDEGRGFVYRPFWYRFAIPA